MTMVTPAIGREDNALDVESFLAAVSWTAAIARSRKAPLPHA
jgi:hypothetical protein